MSKKTSNRFKQLNVLIDHVYPSIGNARGQAALMACYRFADPDGVFHMSAGKLAEIAGLNDNKAARKWLEVLKKCGAIELMSKGNGGRRLDGSGIPNKYRLTFLTYDLSGEVMEEINSILDLRGIMKRLFPPTENQS